MSSLWFLILLFLIICIFPLEVKGNDMDDFQLDLLDKNLSKIDKEKKMTFCFDLTQKEFVEKREIYQKIAASIKEQEKINPSDALRALFHQNLVTCYFNADLKDVNFFFDNNKINKEKLMKIFAATESTPMKFSSNQLKILEKIISAKNRNINKNDSGSVLKYLSGFYGYLYFTSAIFLIGFSFYYVINKLKKSENKLKRKRKNKKE